VKLPQRRDTAPLNDWSLRGPIGDDPRARRILFDTFWTSAGWRERRDQRTPPGDLEYAKAAGYMFDPISADHDEWVRHAMAARDRLTLDEVTDAFVASLSTRWLAGRSALASMATIRHLAPHRYRKWSVNRCVDCGWWSRDEDLSILNFERHKWSGARHGSIAYAWFDLSVFLNTERRTPGDADRQILSVVLGAAKDSPHDARPRDLERAIAAALPSSRAERDILLGILAMAGVLPTNHPAPLEEWVRDTEREPPPKPWKNDWLYPIFWWRGSDGVDQEVAGDLFGLRLT
jgi:hypothetical protein